MPVDCYLENGKLKRHRPQPLQWISFLLIAVFSLWMFYREYNFVNMDLYTHARLASEFDFTDLHTITQRLAYPVWHLFVAVLYQVGVPIGISASIVCTACKMLGMWLVWRTLWTMCGKAVSETVITIATFALMIVTCICIPDINIFVYRPVGSPTVWHNPTQLAVIVTMLVCVPYTIHCWYEFGRQSEAKIEKILLPKGKVLFLAFILLVSVATKPTFLQALIPAAALFFLVQWIKNPKQWRYFVQLILAYLPAVLYFGLQYLYYTGVVVPYSSGVEIGITMASFEETIRNVLMMNAFPLFAILCCYKKGMFKDKQLVLILLMAIVAALEAMTFRETGMREDHGNFYWAGMSVSLMLWVHMMGIYLRDVAQMIKNKGACKLRMAGYGVGGLLILWHLGSGIYYVAIMIIRNAAF